MYSTCLRCERSLGTNSEIAHIRVGRRVAFDTERGRLWVICPHCGQWNLTPIEERWEALAECDALARGAEARGGGAVAALAQTASGLELLRVGGMSGRDIANWRYGRRLAQRRDRRVLALLPLEGLAIGLGLAAWRSTGLGSFGAYVALLVGAAAFGLWYRPPRLWLRFDDGEGHRRLLWPWELQQVRLEPARSASESPELVIPRLRGDLRLRGARGAVALASLLPKINGADCVGVDLRDAVQRVADAERQAQRPPARPGRGARRRARQHGQVIAQPVARRPWEQLVCDEPSHWLLDADPEFRLALEMTVTEEVEQRELDARGDALADVWRDEEEVGAISDDLLLPGDVRKRLDALKARGDGGSA
jgi:hypothetical protein